MDRYYAVVNKAAEEKGSDARIHNILNFLSIVLRVYQYINFYMDIKFKMLCIYAKLPFSSAAM